LVKTQDFQNIFKLLMELHAKICIMHRRISEMLKFNSSVISRLQYTFHWALPV